MSNENNCHEIIPLKHNSNIIQKFIYKTITVWNLHALYVYLYPTPIITLGNNVLKCNFGAMVCEHAKVVLFHFLIKSIRWYLSFLMFANFLLVIR